MERAHVWILALPPAPDKTGTALLSLKEVWQGSVGLKEELNTQGSAQILPGLVWSCKVASPGAGLDTRAEPDLPATFLSRQCSGLAGRGRFLASLV